MEHCVLYCELPYLTLLLHAGTRPAPAVSNGKSWHAILGVITPLKLHQTQTQTQTQTQHSAATIILSIKDPSDSTQDELSHHYSCRDFQTGATEQTLVDAACHNDLDHAGSLPIPDNR